MAGKEHRHRAGFLVGAFGQVVAGDYQNGRLYVVTQDEGTDDGIRIRRQRSFPHATDGGARVSYTALEADMLTGTAGPASGDVRWQVMLDWSDDRGATYGAPVPQTLGGPGERKTVPTWRRLGLARDRIWRLTWDTPDPTGLNGAFVSSRGART